MDGTPKEPPPPYTAGQYNAAREPTVFSISQNAQSVPSATLATQLPAYSQDQTQFGTTQIGRTQMTPVVLMANSQTAYYGTPYYANEAQMQTRVVHLYAVRRRHMIIRGVSFLITIVIIIIVFSIIFS